MQVLHSARLPLKPRLRPPPSTTSSFWALVVAASPVPCARLKTASSRFFLKRWPCCGQHDLCCGLPPWRQHLLPEGQECSGDSAEQFLKDWMKVTQGKADESSLVLFAKTPMPPLNGFTVIAASTLRQVPACLADAFPRTSRCWRTQAGWRRAGPDAHEEGQGAWCRDPLQHEGRGTAFR